MKSTEPRLENDWWIIPVPVSSTRFGAIVGLHKQTLAKMDNEGTLVAGRTPSGKQRRYGQEHYDQLMKIMGIEKPKKEKQDGII